MASPSGEKIAKAMFFTASIWHDLDHPMLEVTTRTTGFLKERGVNQAVNHFISRADAGKHLQLLYELFLYP